MIMRTDWISVQPVRLNSPSHVTRAVLGGVAWLVALGWVHPAPQATEWAVALLLLSPLVLVPLGMRLAMRPADLEVLSPCWRAAGAMQLPTAVLLVVAFLGSEGLLAAALCLPWLTTTTLLGLVGAARIWRRGLAPLPELCADAGLLFLPVGAVWAVVARWGLRPLNFEPVIVLLTAVHFHYAGFVLPLLTGLAGRVVGGRVAEAASVGVVAGVPLVAAGITATQLGLGSLLGCFAACLTTLAAVLTAWLHLRLVGDCRWARLVRGLWCIASLSLVGSMALAALYSCRAYVPMAWLDIPWMRAWHGTGNALGFGLLGVLAWSVGPLRPKEAPR
jgi:hypothetical protein